MKIKKTVLPQLECRIIIHSLWKFTPFGFLLKQKMSANLIVNSKHFTYVCLRSGSSVLGKLFFVCVFTILTVRRYLSQLILQQITLQTECVRLSIADSGLLVSFAAAVCFKFVTATLWGGMRCMAKYLSMQCPCH